MSRRTLAFTVLIGSLVVSAHGTRAAADGYVMICNAHLKVSTLSKADVKALYTGKSKTLGGSAVLVVVRPESDAPFTEFVDHVFGIPTKTLLSKIQQEVFKGEMTKPIKAASDDDVVQHVGSELGTIGVVGALSASHLPATVTVIAIGG
jgi:ABC-type phosphate transport system substrate-binding protein